MSLAKLQANGNYHISVQTQKRMGWKSGDQLLVVDTDKDNDTIVLKRLIKTK